MLDKQGDIDAARAAFRRAIDSGEPEAVEMAVANLDKIGG
jgi:hypothetical protein